MRNSQRRSPEQRHRRAEILAAASGWASGSARRQPPPPLPENAKKVLDAHADNAGQCAAGCGTWPCDRAIEALMLAGGSA